jgi:hypothetical protein
LRKEKSLEELTRQYEALGSPERAAIRWGVEEMVMPEDTRERVGEWVSEV